MTDKSPHETIAAAFGPWSQIGAAWAEAMAGLGGEAVRFLSERMQEDVALQQRLLHAGSVEEVRHVQAQFLQTAIDQYTAETGRMVELSEDLARRLGLPTDE
jgi:hypothetical protein